MTDNAKIDRRTIIGAAAAMGAAAAAAPAQGAQGAPAPSLAGKSVLITGASSGFGNLAALHLARSGATVIASMRNLAGGKRAEAVALRDVAAAESLKLTVIEIDVTKGDQVTKGVAAAEKIAGGALDCVFNNAGIGIPGPIEMHDDAQALKQFDTNLFGYLRVARAALPGMRARGEGLLAQVSSQLGRLVLPNIGVYCATKFAIEAMFEAMAYELAPFGVEATIIQPGGYPTAIWKNGAQYFDDLLAGVDDERKTAYAAHQEMARGLMTGERASDPMDVPRALAEIIALPPGKRPLRRAVHPDTRATDALNKAHHDMQALVLGAGPYKSWRNAVTD